MGGEVPFGWRWARLFSLASSQAPPQWRAAMFVAEAQLSSALTRSRGR